MHKKVQNQKLGLSDSPNFFLYLYLYKNKSKHFELCLNIKFQNQI